MLVSRPLQFKTYGFFSINSNNKSVTPMLSLIILDFRTLWHFHFLQDCCSCVCRLSAATGGRWHGTRLSEGVDGMQLIKSLVLGLVVLAGASTSSQAQSPCPHCGRIHSVSHSSTSNFQAQAQAEAQAMASRNHKGHVQGTVPGVGFCGVGWSSSSSNAPTCTPSSGMSLVADAVARGADGWYRVRYWR